MQISGKYSFHMYHIRKSTNSCWTLAPSIHDEQQLIRGPSDAHLYASLLQHECHYICLEQSREFA